MGAGDALAHVAAARHGVTVSAVAALVDGAVTVVIDVVARLHRRGGLPDAGAVGPSGAGGGALAALAHVERGLIAGVARPGQIFIDAAVAVLVGVVARLVLRPGADGALAADGGDVSEAGLHAGGAHAVPAGVAGVADGGELLIGAAIAVVVEAVAALGHGAGVVTGPEGAAGAPLGAGGALAHVGSTGLGGAVHAAAALVHHPVAVVVHVITDLLAGGDARAVPEDAVHAGLHAHGAGPGVAAAGLSGAVLAAAALVHRAVAVLVEAAVAGLHPRLPRGGAAGELGAVGGIADEHAAHLAGAQAHGAGVAEGVEALVGPAVAVLVRAGTAQLRRGRARGHGAEGAVVAVAGQGAGVGAGPEAHGAGVADVLAAAAHLLVHLAVAVVIEVVAGLHPHPEHLPVGAVGEGHAGQIVDACVADEATDLGQPLVAAVGAGAAAAVGRRQGGVARHVELREAGGADLIVGIVTQRQLAAVAGLALTHRQIAVAIGEAREAAVRALAGLTDRLGPVPGLAGGVARPAVQRVGVEVEGLVGGAIAVVIGLVTGLDDRLTGGGPADDAGPGLVTHGHAAAHAGADAVLAGLVQQEGLVHPAIAVVVEAVAQLVGEGGPGGGVAGDALHVVGIADEDALALADPDPDAARAAEIREGLINAAVAVVILTVADLSALDLALAAVHVGIEIAEAHGAGGAAAPARQALGHGVEPLALGDAGEPAGPAVLLGEVDAGDVALAVLGEPGERLVDVPIAVVVFAVARLGVAGELGGPRRADAGGVVAVRGAQDRVGRIGAVGLRRADVLAGLVAVAVLVEALVDDPVAVVVEAITDLLHRHDLADTLIAQGPTVTEELAVLAQPHPPGLVLQPQRVAGLLGALVGDAVAVVIAAVAGLVGGDDGALTAWGGVAVEIDEAHEALGAAHPVDALRQRVALAADGDAGQVAGAAVLVADVLPALVDVDLVGLAVAVVIEVVAQLLDAALLSLGAVELAHGQVAEGHALGAGAQQAGVAVGAALGIALIGGAVAVVIEAVAQLVDGPAAVALEPGPVLAAHHAVEQRLRHVEAGHELIIRPADADGAVGAPGPAPEGDPGLALLVEAVAEVLIDAAIAVVVSAVAQLVARRPARLTARLLSGRRGAVGVVILIHAGADAGAAAGITAPAHEVPTGGPGAQGAELDEGGAVDLRGRIGEVLQPELGGLAVVDGEEHRRRGSAHAAVRRRLRPLIVELVGVHHAGVDALDEGPGLARLPLPQAHAVVAHADGDAVEAVDPEREGGGAVLIAVLHQDPRLGEGPGHPLGACGAQIGEVVHLEQLGLTLGGHEPQLPVLHRGPLLRRVRGEAHQLRLGRGQLRGDVDAAAAGVVLGGAAPLLGQRLAGLVPGHEALPVDGALVVELTVVRRRRDVGAAFKGQQAAKEREGDPREVDRETRSGVLCRHGPSEPKAEELDVDVVLPGRDFLKR